MSYAKDTLSRWRRSHVRIRPREFSKLGPLSKSQRAKLHSWLRNDLMTYAEIAKKINEHFGISISNTALHYYYKKRLFRKPGGGTTKGRWGVL